MNHTVMIRGPVARKHSSPAKGLYYAFEDAKHFAKQIYRARNQSEYSLDP